MALLAGSLSLIAPVAAHADTASSTGSPPVVSDPEAIASAQAQTTGKSVPVTADYTTSATTAANPDGSFTVTASPVPIQVQQGGSWVPVDATLQQNTNGTFSPKAAESQVAFSGGGSAPLATLTNSQGQQISLSWPSPLPTPTVSGASVTYPSVLPGVNLEMTATTAGGYTEDLIVNNATAAANPALADIHFNTSTSSGLTLSTNSAGGLQATDASGAVAFTSPTATMWSTPSTGSTSQASRTKIMSASSAGDTTPQDDADPVTDLGVDVTSSGVNLLPPVSALTASSNTYPLVIDPSLTPAAAELGWTWTSSVNSGTSYWQGSNNTHDTDAHVGYDDWCSNGSSGCTAFGITRSLFSFDMTGLAGKHVTGATLSMTEQGPTSSISGSKQIDLHGGGAISSSTTWSNQSVWSAVSATADFPSINSNATGNANFDVSSLVEAAVAAGYHSQTMVLEADNESDDTAYRYFIGSSTATDHPSLQVTYWSTPNLPTNLSINNTGTTTACNTTAPGTWINKNDADTVTLGASLTGPDYGYSEDAQFWYQKIGNTSWTNLGGPTITATSTPTPVTSPALPTLADGDEYQWQVYAGSDNNTYSSGAAPSGASCWFRTDFTPPTVSVNTTATTAPTSVGSTGTLSLTATDPGTNPSGVAAINYNIDGTSVDSGGGGEQTVNASTATITLPATNWGTHVVWYDTVDNAGNVSAPQHYDYYVADGTFTPGTAGDLDGDGKPDLATIDASGAIRYYSDPFANSPNGITGNPYGGVVMLKPTQAPNGTSFTGALVAHQGSFTGQTCDDLVIIQAGSLHMATDNDNCNPTNGWTLGAGQQRPTKTTGDTTNYNANDWSSVEQAVVLPATSATNSKPALVTLEDDNGVQTLWMYTAVGSTFNSATLLATGSYWSHVTLISPGLVNGAPALWVRDTSTGALDQYQSIETWQGLTTPPTPDVIANSGFRVGQYPSITSDGPEDGTTPTLWATNRTGRLYEIPTAVNAGSITLDTPVPVSTVGWASGIQTLEGVKPIYPTSTIGLYRASTNTFIFDTANNSTTVDHTLQFGQAGDIPLVGDWSGTGVDGVGVYRPSNQTFYLDDSNTVSEIDYTIRLGDSGDIPVVGDWNGSGIDTIGVYRPSNAHFYLDDSLTAPKVDHVVWFGDTGDQPLVGDWNNTGIDSVGLYRPSTAQFILAQSLDDNTAEYTQAYGDSGDTPITGDWIGQGIDTIGIWRSGDYSFNLDNSLTSGVTNQTTAFGITTDTPITGDWNGQ